LKPNFIGFITTVPPFPKFAILTRVHQQFACGMDGIAEYTGMTFFLNYPYFLNHLMARKFGACNPQQQCL
jgi:hypothetical protein